MLEPPHGTQFGQASLSFINYQQCSAFFALTLEFAEPSIWQVNHAAGAEQWLSDNSSQRAVSLSVQQVKASIKAGVITTAPVLAVGAAVFIGRQDWVVPRSVGSITLVPSRERDRSG